jgi:hypothetical protein
MENNGYTRHKTKTKKDNSEKRVTLDTQDIRRRQKGQFRETGNNGYTRHNTKTKRTIQRNG